MTGDPQRDRDDAALRQSCGLIERRTARLEMTGADRQRFLNGLVTCDVKPLAPGQGTYGFLTTAKGRILADVTVLALADRLWLELPPASEELPAPGEAIAAHLGKYVIADRVEIAPLTGWVVLSLIGPAAAEVLAESAALAAGDELPAAPYAHVAGELAGVAVRLVRESDLGAPCWALWAAADDAAPLVAALRERGAPHGLREVGEEACERLRIEAGRPLFGRDFGSDNFPQETGIETAVSYTKGCYLGQEVVARIHYRGGVNRRLRGLDFATGAEPAASLVGRPVLCEARPAGTVTSATESAAGRRLGLSVLHQRAAPGAQVEVENGPEGVVVELPFAAGEEGAGPGPGPQGPEHRP